MTQRKSQSDHDTHLAQLVSYLKNNEYKNIKADLSSHDSPDKISFTGQQGGHIPDATANLGNIPWIFEVETEDTITIEHSESQWKLFAAHANNNNGQFCVVVPQDSKSAAEQQVKKLGITAEVWT